MDAWNLPLHTVVAGADEVWIKRPGNHADGVHWVGFGLDEDGAEIVPCLTDDDIAERELTVLRIGLPVEHS